MPKFLPFEYRAFHLYTGVSKIDTQLNRKLDFYSPFHRIAES